MIPLGFVFIIVTIFSSNLDQSTWTEAERKRVPQMKQEMSQFVKDAKKSVPSHDNVVIDAFDVVESSK